MISRFYLMLRYFQVKSCTFAGEFLSATRALYSGNGQKYLIHCIFFFPVWKRGGVRSLIPIDLSITD